jgi:hypothetical protein
MKFKGKLNSRGEIPGDATNLPRARPSLIPLALPMVAKIYAHHAAGCCWHIVLDDYNVDNDSVDFCIKHNEEEDCPLEACKQLGPIMLVMSKTQRLKLAKSWYEFIPRRK